MMQTRRMEYSETTTTRREVRQVPHYPERDLTNRRSVSSEDMRGLYRAGSEKDVVVDTLAALVTDVNQTAEILRRGASRPRDSPPPQPEEDSGKKLMKEVREEVIEKKEHRPKFVSPPPPVPRHQDIRPVSTPPRGYDSESDLPPSLQRTRGAVKVLPQEPEVQYKLRIAGPLMSSPSPSSNASTPFPGPKRRTPGPDERCSVERVCQDFGIPMPDESLKKRARSETPGTRRMIRVESSQPPPDGPICAACHEVVRGPCITALAPNSERAQKFHPEHFVCTYCQKSLNQRGTYKEHEKKPYCHDCFYKLYSGHIYSDPNARPR